MTNKLLITIISILLCGCSRTAPGLTNMSSKPYYCRGSWYFPQHYYEYDKVGIASWYGNDFHNKKKANGQKFNMYDMTAAHRTLPLPTVARVTNLKNNKSIIVVIDDRGPYVYAGRILDLSYQAAKKLNLAICGITKVRVQSLPQESLKLSNYIKRHKDSNKYKSWYELYIKKIAKK